MISIRISKWCRQIECFAFIRHINCC